MTRDEIRKKWQNGEFVGKQSEDNIAEGTTLRPSNQRALNENKNVWQQVMDRTEQMMNTSSNLVQSDQYRISDSRLGRKVGGVLDKVFSGGKATKNFQQKDLVDEKNIRYNGVAARGDRTDNEAGNIFAKREKDYGKGNIDLNNRPVVVDGDGNISTVRSMSFYDEDEGKEVLIPTVVNGRIVSDEEAIKHYRETGEYLGKFDTVKEADKYAEELHNSQEKMYGSNIKNKSLFEDAKDIGKAALLGARNVGEKQISYFENMTNEKFKGYRDFQKEAGIRQYLQESGKPLLTAYDKGETKILNEEVSENPTRDTIDSWMNSTEEEIQSIINRQSNPVTKILAELTPSMTQSALGTVVKAINPGMNIVYWLTSSGGDYVKSAQQRGITGQAANIYGTLLGSFDAAYEFVGNTITENAFGSGAKGTLKDVLKNMGIGAFENAVEEAVMEPTEEAVAKGFGGEYSFDDLPARMWEAGWKGAVSGAILDAASSGLGKATSIVTKANNKEMITTDDIRDALMEINKNEEYDLEKMLIDNFGTKSLDNLANGLYNIEGRQEKINKDTKKRMEKVAEDINQDEAKKIMAKNTEPEEKQATTIENKPLLQQEQQTNQEETKEAKNENIEQTEEIEKKEEEKPKSLLIKPKLDNELIKDRAKIRWNGIKREIQYKENKIQKAETTEKLQNDKNARQELIDNIEDYIYENNGNREQVKHIKNNAIEQGIDAEKFKSLSKEKIEGLMNNDIPKYKEENKVQENKPKERPVKLPEVRKQEEVKTEENADVTADDLNALDIERDKQRNLQNLRKDKSKVNYEVTELLNKENEVKERIKQNAKNEKIAEKMNDGYEEDEAREKRYNKIEQKEYSKEQSEEGKGYAGNDSYFEDVANYNNTKRSNRYKLSKKIERRALDSFLNSEEARKRVTEAANIDDKNYTLTKKDIANDAGHIKTAIDLMEKEGRFEEYENKVIDEARKSSKEPFKKKEGEPFTCVVVGSRGFKDYNKMKTELDRLLANQDDVTIVSGGANGADKMAERYAKEKGYKTKIFEVDWKKGNDAGYKRNNEMHKYAAENGNRGVVAFWDGKSNGTKHSFALSQEYDNDIKLIDVEDAKTLLEREKQEALELLKKDAAAYDEFDNKYNQRIQQAAQNNEEQGTGTTQRKVNEALEEKDDNEDVETLDTTDMDKTESEEYDEDKALDILERNYLGGADGTTWDLSDLDSTDIKEETPSQELPQQAKPNNQEPTTEELNDISRQQRNERKQQRKETWTEANDRMIREKYGLDEDYWNSLEEDERWVYRNKRKNSSTQRVESDIRNNIVERVEQSLDKSKTEDDVIGILDGDVTAENVKESLTAKELWEEYKEQELNLNNENSDLTFETFDGKMVSTREKQEFERYLGLVSPERFIKDLKNAVAEKNKTDFKNTYGISEPVYNKALNVKDAQHLAENEQIIDALALNDDQTKYNTLVNLGRGDVVSKADFIANLKDTHHTPGYKNIDYTRYLNEKLRRLVYDKVNEQYDLREEFTAEQVRSIRALEQEIATKKIAFDRYRKIARGLMDNGVDVFSFKEKMKGLKARATLEITQPIRINEMMFDKETANKLNEEFINPLFHSLAEENRYKENAYRRIDDTNILESSEDSHLLFELIEGHKVKNNKILKDPFSPQLLLKELNGDQARFDKIIAGEKVLGSLYDEMMNMYNSVMVEEGLQPLKKRKHYITHIMTKNQNHLGEAIIRMLGSKTQEDKYNAINEIKRIEEQIDEDEQQIENLTNGKANSTSNELTLEGLEQTKSLSPFAKARTGKTEGIEADAIKAAKLYVRNMSDAIFLTKDIQKLRTLEKMLMQVSGMDTMRDEEALFDLDNLTREQKQIMEEYKKNGAMSEYVRYLDAYINNSLLGQSRIKDADLDKAFDIVNSVVGRFGKNVINYNIGSALTNFAPVAKTIAQTDKISTLKAIGQMAAENIGRPSDGVLEKSDTFARRFLRRHKFKR